jgi:4-hydroxybenzoate polyprenyltransferase
MKKINPSLKFLSYFLLLPRLYRIDVFLIVIFNYFIGLFLAERNFLFSQEFFHAILLSLLSMNYVYSYNSWSDIEIDKINKPKRVLATGKLHPTYAYYYSQLLFVFSFLYPFIIYKNSFSLILAIMIPVFGYLYSAPTIKLKRYHLFAVLLTTLLYIIPIAIGYIGSETMTNSLITWKFLFYILYFFSTIFTIIPLKDIEDTAGDFKYFCQNWFTLYKTKIFYFYLGGQFFAIVLILLISVPILEKIILIFYNISLIILILLFFLRQWDLNLLYRLIIKITIVFELISLLILSRLSRLAFYYLSSKLV